MPSYARKQIVDDTQIGVYQCIGRCVRRAFLCGKDAVSGRDFSRRKVWLQGRFESLASLFAVGGSFQTPHFWGVFLSPLD